MSVGWALESHRERCILEYKFNTRIYGPKAPFMTKYYLAQARTRFRSRMGYCYMNSLTHCPSSMESFLTFRVIHSGQSSLHFRLALSKDLLQ